jgi:hypothetical protein
VTFGSSFKSPMAKIRDIQRNTADSPRMNHFILKNRNNPKAKGLKHQPLLSPWHRCSNSENAIDFTFMSFVLYLHTVLDLILLSESVQMAPPPPPPMKSSVIKPPCLWRWQRYEPHHPSKAAMMVSEPPASWHAAPLSSFPKS